MFLSSFLGGRSAAVIRLAGLTAVVWSILGSNNPPATSGRGLVVLVAGLIAVGSWLTWMAWSSRTHELTPDIWTLAVAGGVLLGATPSSASAIFVFVSCSVASMRVGLTRAAPVVATGIIVQAISVLIYDRSGLGLLAYALGELAVALGASNVRQMRARAEQAELLLVQTQRSHEEQLRSAHLAESARIAREIHDVLAHALAGLTIQLEATAVLVEQGAEQAVVLGRLRHAHQLAREGLQETRRAVGALRGDAPAVGPTLEVLVAAYRADAGASAELQMGVVNDVLDGPEGEAVLRVVQEALTNVRKHAPGAAVMVSVERDPSGALVVLIEDTPPRGVVTPAPAGASLAASGGGYGIRGMRERAALLGGTLQAGPAAERWRVELRLPADAGKDGSGTDG